MYMILHTKRCGPRSVSDDSNINVSVTAGEPLVALPISIVYSEAFTAQRAQIGVSVAIKVPLQEPFRLIASVSACPFQNQHATLQIDVGIRQPVSASNWTGLTEVKERPEVKRDGNSRVYVDLNPHAHEPVAQELCESRGGRPGLPSLISLRFLWT